MKKKIFLLLIGIYFNCVGQTKNSKILYFTMLTLNQNNRIMPMGGLGYEQKILKNISISYSARYGQVQELDPTFKQAFEEHYRTIVGADLNISLIKIRNNKFRLNTGPSIWYSKDKTLGEFKQNLVNPSRLQTFSYIKNARFPVGLNTSLELKSKFIFVPFGLSFGGDITSDKQKYFHFNILFYL